MLLGAHESMKQQLIKVCQVEAIYYSILKTKI